jgi:hypothetical protein
MSFEFDSFAGALWTLWEAIDRTADTVGIAKPALLDALGREALVRGDKWEANLWSSAHSKIELGKWIYKSARKFDIGNEAEVLQLAKEVPTRVRRSLIEIAKRIPPSHGGKAPALGLIETWRVRSEVRKLHESGVPKDKAYSQVAKRTGVSAHTVRRIYDPRERKRSRLASRKMVFLTER